MVQNVNVSRDGRQARRDNGVHRAWYKLKCYLSIYTHKTKKLDSRQCTMAVDLLTEKNEIMSAHFD